MKKQILKSLLFIVSVSMLALSCSDNEKTSKNEVTFDGSKSRVKGAYSSPAFTTENNQAVVGSSFYLAITTDQAEVVRHDEYGYDEFVGSGQAIQFNIRVAGEHETLPAGTYSYNETSDFPSLHWGYLISLEDDSHTYIGDITAGTIKVSKSGTTYTFDFSFTITLEDGETTKTFSGVYKGKLGSYVPGL